MNTKQLSENICKYNNNIVATILTDLFRASIPNDYFIAKAHPMDPIPSIYSYHKGTVSGLRQFLATVSPLKLKKNAFYFTSKALFVLKIFKF